MAQDKSTKNDSAATLPALRGDIAGFLSTLQQEVGDAVPSAKLDATVYALVDCSASMSAHGKLEQAKAGLLEFVGRALADGYRAGLICFASTAGVVCRATGELAGLKAEIEELAPAGTTNLAAGIELGHDLLASERGKRVILIVTDGQPDDERAAIEAAESAQRVGIEFLVIGTDDANWALLRRLTPKEGTSLYVDRQQLALGFTKIAGLLPRPASGGRFPKNRER